MSLAERVHDARDRALRHHGRAEGGRGVGGRGADRARRARLRAGPPPARRRRDVRGQGGGRRRPCVAAGSEAEPEPREHPTPTPRPSRRPSRPTSWGSARGRVPRSPATFENAPTRPAPTASVATTQATSGWRATTTAKIATTSTTSAALTATIAQQIAACRERRDERVRLGPDPWSRTIRTNVSASAPWALPTASSIPAAAFGVRGRVAHAASMTLSHCTVLIGRAPPVHSAPSTPLCPMDGDAHEGRRRQGDLRPENAASPWCPKRSAS